MSTPTTEPPADLPEEALHDLVEAAQAHRAPAALDLEQLDTRGTPAWPHGKALGKVAVGRLNERLEALQEKMYAEGERRLLVVLQATDTAGKDSTIRHVFDGTNPQGVKVASFKRPTEAELARDYLWRVHAHVPADGQITIFNRSHYEDVLVVRVHDLVPQARWSRRYGHIADFERLLADEGTHIIKIFLHLSKGEQAERLQERLDDPEKHWKFSIGDLAERKRWVDYQAAFTEMIRRTDADHAPWFVVPADRKWYRNLVISGILIHEMESWEMEWPEAEEGLEDVVIE
ncbi:PPK2 family polyphosphate kinase [Euzebya tangerina]|uniref:PPK2 family polyphosphate kinase n=1 Tax=Euzebya tangerina TaxID=591198 RepID=UPI000E31FEDB|nr:PPK2 family polyphosphate kinase [Euzebya tangerina]